MRQRTYQQGFSLLEMLIAFVIMAAGLAVLYESSGGSLSAVSEAEKQVRAIQLAQSVLSMRAVVPKEGWQESGEFDGLAWQVSSAAYDIPTSNGFQLPWKVHRVQVTVRWQGFNGERDYVLVTLLPENPLL